MARKQLPPKFVAVVYAVYGIVSAILFYFGIMFGIRFTSVMEGVWAFAFVVAMVLEFFIHQLVIAAVRAAAVIMFQPLRSDNHEEQREGQMTQSQLSSKTYQTIATSRNMERIRQIKSQTKPSAGNQS